MPEQHITNEASDVVLKSIILRHTKDLEVVSELRTLQATILTARWENSFVQMTKK